MPESDNVGLDVWPLSNLVHVSDPMLSVMSCLKHMASGRPIDFRRIELIVEGRENVILLAAPMTSLMGAKIPFTNGLTGRSAPLPGRSLVVAP